MPVVSRRFRTPSPGGPWTTQQIRNLLMDLGNHAAAEFWSPAARVLEPHEKSDGIRAHDIHDHNLARYRTALSVAPFLYSRGFPPSMLMPAQHFGARIN
jgi:hypothetical protein